MTFRLFLVKRTNDAINCSIDLDLNFFYFCSLSGYGLYRLTNHSSDWNKYLLLICGFFYHFIHILDRHDFHGSSFASRTQKTFSGKTQLCDRVTDAFSIQMEADVVYISMLINIKMTDT